MAASSPPPFSPPTPPFFEDVEDAPTSHDERVQLEALAESLLLQVAERDVELSELTEKHAQDMQERRWEAAP